MSNFEASSLEELRLADYKLGNKSSNSTSLGGSSAFGGFGSKSSTPFGSTISSGQSNVFGNNNPTSTFSTNNTLSSSTFGQPPQGSSIGQSLAFGSQPSTFGGGFGQPATTTSGFGQSTSNSSAFGQPNSGTSAFGQSTFSFSQPSTSTPFGQPATGASAFGQSTSTFGQPLAGASPFGQSTSTFGQPTTGTSAFGQPASSTFGQPASAFGVSNPTSGFSQTSTFSALAPGFGLSQQSPFSGGFGQQSTNTFSGLGNTTALQSTPVSGFSGFGTSNILSQPSSNFSFSQPQVGISNPVNTLANAPQNFDISQKIEFLKKKSDSLEIHTGNDKAQSIDVTFELPQKVSNFVKVPSWSSRGLAVRLSRSMLPRGSNNTSQYRIEGSQSDIENKDSVSKQLHSIESVVIPSDSKADLIFNAKRLVIAKMPVQVNNNATSNSDDAYQSHYTDVNNIETPLRYSANHESTVKSSVRFENNGEKTGLTPVTTTSPSSISPTKVDSASKNKNIESTNIHSSPSSRSSIVFPREYEKNDISSNKYQDTQALVAVNNESGPPMLTKEGYHTIPDIATLQNLSDEDLSQVKNFTIYRHEYGKICWEGLIDVRGLDLDNIVSIDFKEVRVYEDNADFPSPPLGIGLNRPATITLYQIFPKKISPEHNRVYENKLRQFCDNNEAEFISYDADLGEWVFLVKHFSKYGLVDDDDEDMASEAQPSNTKQIVDNKNDSNINIKVMSESPAAAVERVDFVQIKKLNISDSSKPLNPINSVVNMVSDEEDEKVSEKVNTKSETLFFTLEKKSINRRHGRQSNISPSLTILPSIRKREEVNSVKGFQSMRTKFKSKSEKDPITYFLSIPETTSSEMSSMSIKGTNESILNPLFKESARKAFIEAMNEDFDIASSPSMQLLQEVKSEFFRNTGQVPVGVDTSRVSGLGVAIVQSLQKPMRNYAMTMSRSFRVSISSLGHIAHVGKPIMCNSQSSPKCYGRHIVVEKLNPMSHFRGDISFLSNQFDSLLCALLRNSSCESKINPQVPLWSLPVCDINDLQQYTTFLNMVSSLKNALPDYNRSAYSVNDSNVIFRQAIELVDVSVGQENQVFPGKLKSLSNAHVDSEDVDLLPFCEDTIGYSISQIERRKQSLSNWLKSISSVELPSSMKSKPTEAIFDLLTCHQIEEAISIAEDNNLYRLAMLLSQVDGDQTIVHLLRHQLDLWRTVQAYEVMPKDIIDIYRLISADFFPTEESGWTNSIVYKKGWIRALGSLYWYNESADMIAEGNFGNNILSSALHRFEEVLALELVDVPKPSYEISNRIGLCIGAEYPKVTNGLYALLRACFIGTESNEESLHALSQALHPQGYTADALDYRVSYILMSLFISMGLLSIDSDIVYIITQHFISQLLYFGEWKWAVFVAMQISDDRVRSNTVRSIILRYASVDPNWEAREDSDEVFVMNQLLIHKELIFEAACYRLYEEEKFLESLFNAHQANMFVFAKKIICRKLFPLALLKSSSEGGIEGNEKILSLLEIIANDEIVVQETNETIVPDVWTDEANIIMTFLRLKKFIRETQREELSQENKISLILNETEVLLKRLTKLYEDHKYVETSLLHDDYRVRIAWQDMFAYLHKVIKELKIKIYIE